MCRSRKSTIVIRRDPANEIRQLFNPYIGRVHTLFSIDRTTSSEYLRTMHLLPCCTKYAKVDMSVCRAEQLSSSHRVAIQENCLENNLVAREKKYFFFTKV